MKATDRYF